MFKLVVLSALLAAVVAEPALIINPLDYYPTTFTAPATTYVQQTSSYVPSPILSPALGIPHYIKKRSAPLLTAAAPIIAPGYGTPYIAPAPLPAAYPSAIIPGGYYPSYYAGYPAGLPYIKK